MILTEKARECFIKEYALMMSQNECLPTDWLWSYCISKYGLKAYAPIKPAVTQIEGLESTITGKKRENKNFD